MMYLFGKFCCQKLRYSPLYYPYSLFRFSLFPKTFHKQIHHAIRYHEKGTTLVELIVAISLFLTVISIVVPTLFTTIKMQRNVNGLVRMHNSLSYAMEYIAKEMRTGRKFQAQSLDKSFIRFTNYHNEEVTYQFDPTRHALTRQVTGQGSFDLISSDVTLNDFRFWVNTKSTGGEDKQLSIVILANASPVDGFTDTKTQFQTTISPLLRSDVTQ
ncbi:MAG: hypothetical protein HZA35_04290 [Parcubacteria group bacterium]|nr:hypothetical protein [Parcubacteria group bacterium]